MITYQLYTMLRLSHFRGRYNPPTTKRVGKESMAVYLYSALIASIATWSIPGLPFEGGSYNGFACFPKDYDTASTIFFWLVFVPAFLLIPLGYVCWCAARILWKGWIPPAGRRRNLAVYFFRLIFVFVAMWLPFIIIAFVWAPASSSQNSYWVLWVGASWSHLQGLVSVLFALTKEDVKDCFIGTVTCKCWNVQLRRQEQIRNPTQISNGSDRSVGDDADTEQAYQHHPRSYSIMKSFNWSIHSSMNRSSGSSTQEVSLSDTQKSNMRSGVRDSSLEMINEDIDPESQRVDDEESFHSARADEIDEVEEDAHNNKESKADLNRDDSGKYLG